MYRPVLILAALGLGAVSMHAFAASLPESMAPLPYVKPENPVAITMPAAMPAPDVTGTIPRTDPLVVAPQLKAGLDALAGNDIAAALATRNGLAEGSLDRHILTWAIATSGAPGVPSGEIAAAQTELKGWPGLKGLRANSERALYRENPPVPTVLAAFGATRPETTEGTIILARALVASGKQAEAARPLRQIWLTDTLDKPTEDKILAEFSALFTAADHKARMDFLMYKARAAQAKRFGDLGKAQSLYKAWAAVIGNAKNAEALLTGVDGSLKDDAGYLFARVEYLRRQDKYQDAADLLEKAPREAAKLVNTTEWWNERRIVARGLADQGEFKLAYRTAANYVAASSTDIVDAEFHAGWYALRALHEPATAEKHFRKILDTSNKPLSASRALYWLGRAAEDGGPGSAKEFFAKAAHFSSTFYGQLAAARLDLKSLDVTYPAASGADRQNFESREAVRAIARLEDAGHGKRAAVLYRALAEEMTSPGELAILAARAESEDNHALSLQIGKTAFSRGIDVAALAFPVGVIPAGADIEGSGKALAYAIARQESAFNPGAVSPANARGLLQILPGTAQGVAKRHGLTYAAARLTTDAGYNATLGAHYLGEQIDTFGGSYILTFVAYNAGPKRVPEWITRYGDPRGKSLDEVVDWIERIPFPETRNYVQRVMENYQVYKTRLGQKADIDADLRFGRQ
ncbi:lytic transglycosylase domain-containing protein [Neorhizobium galegae]|uniref:Soluble lytic murein transglycosylase (Slt) n=1 Tax=Neorhizobium galegae bv. orientalis str. HAMBI 540 TaxID=1028800 RepID=A0A068SMY8_NEOGA|nr:lytic transglycosylase domain-containing protein [Neorhizobium galegae]CDN47141.1 Soluble lytic murein transglycosylase (Slt) [Neorhizobium galegae bv. orientalis str. HAMBI 540]